MKRIVIFFIALALFDAIFGGAISALLQLEGWTPLDQRINNVYQTIYGVAIIASLYWLWNHTHSKTHISIISILFLGYVEDTIFYILQPLLKPIISLLTLGASFTPPDGPLNLFPSYMSGYLGWLGRIFFGQNIAIPIEWVIIINISAITVALFLVSNKKHQ